MKLEQSYIIEDVSITRNDQLLNIKFKNNKSVKCFLLAADDACFNKNIRLVDTSFSNTFIVENNREKPIYFKISFNGQNSTQIFSERILPLDKAINIRDLGGYTTVDKRTVKWGKLYRGDQLNNLSLSDIEFIKQLSLTEIIDYRNELERENYPNKKIKTVKMIHYCNPKHEMSEISAQATNLDEENKLLVRNLLKNPELLNEKMEDMRKQYSEFVLSKESRLAYSQVLDITLNHSNGALLQHCRGGKDRTGFGSALLLLILGVNEEQIIQDYMITNHVRKERNFIKMNQYRELTDNISVLNYLSSLIETREEFIFESLIVLKKKYGTIQKFADKGLNFSYKKQLLLKEKYLL